MIFYAADESFFIEDVYWTALSRSGCPTHFTNCFHTVAPFFAGEEVMSLPLFGGSCIAGIVMRREISPKPIRCDAKLRLACEGDAKNLKQKTKVLKCKIKPTLIKQFFKDVKSSVAKLAENPEENECALDVRIC